MHLKSTWKYFKLKQKILLLFLPLTIVAIVLVLGISISLLVQSGRADALKNSEDKLILVTVQTEQVLSNIMYNIKVFSTSSDLQEALRTNYPINNYGNYLFSSAMHSSLHNIMNIKTLISNGYIQTFDGKVFDIETDEITYSDDIMNRRYKEIVSKKGHIILGPPISPSGENAISVSKSLIDINTGVCLGVLVCDIKESIFHSSYAPISNNDDERFLLTDAMGNIISSDDKTELHCKVPEHFSELIDSLDQRIIVNPSSIEKLVMASNTNIGNYRVIYELNYHYIYKDALKLALFLSIMGLFIIIISIFLSTLLARSIVHPITELAVYADEAGKGHFDFPISIQSSDEIGFLAERFRVMADNIKELTVRIYNEQNQRKEFELKLLQAQINPHFLYNCLDNISSLIADNKNSTALSMVYHIGRYYRAVLSNGRNIITIREEIDMIKDYLEIYLIKSPNLFTYHIDIDASIIDYKILKMLLQPIVENSLIHGFNGYLKDRTISIKGFTDKNDIN